jgi:uncharacterized protein (DUF433 family)
MTDTLVTSHREVQDNVLRFAGELEKHPELAEIMAYTRAWYAMRTEKGAWAFAPSKFAGYAKNSARNYLRTHNTGHDGRLTERVLRQWFHGVKPGTALHEELLGELNRLFAQFGKTPNRLLRINVPVADADNRPGVPSRNKQVSVERITVRPDVCGGRPCIRGMRVRVSDILDLLAAGEDRQQILSEYPYLESEDIDAALAYAARTVDHRIIEAA